MAVKVYGFPLLEATRNVIAAFYEKDVNLPIYQDGEITLFESREINRYIATKYEGKGTPLYGKTLTEKALVEQWMEVEGQNYHPVITALNYQLLVKKIFTGEGPDDAAVAVDVPRLNPGGRISSRPSWQKTITYGSS
ncbi:hypothetical protein R1sor_012026 [Riccia sorocarpa]|uniref:glutathione transferase n=1 Tax=Riccia sorocarpa TaxID=122646 RepID=A0ABD3I2M2_9MARC